jgi:uncharacterized MnhB-related membrane protein
MDLTALQIVVLTFVALVAVAVVLTRRPARQAVVLGVYGLLLTIMFFSLQAPDVALSALAISTVGLPVMLLIALAKVNQQEQRRRRAQHDDEDST